MKFLGDHLRSLFVSKLKGIVVFVSLICILSGLIGCTGNNGNAQSNNRSFAKSGELNSAMPVVFDEIAIGGELLQRLHANFNRLEEEKYQPQNVYLTEEQSKGWPGDTEGRTILGLVLDAQASHRSPKYLKAIIDELPGKLNANGYLGIIYPSGVFNEQQLSGHGWLLRGLCEYYSWQKDAKVLGMIRQIVNNLVLPTAGHHKNYPIDPLLRTHTGEYSGTSQGIINEWIVSSDIGCDFIFMDGVIQAYTLVPSPELKTVIEEMIHRFLEIDLIAIKAQTHATLTALRGLLRYYEITGQTDLLQAVEKRFILYKQNAMTENFENYNWFGRPDWTEPCAVIDSYIVAFGLWRFTGKAEFLEDAHLIYFNAMNHEQRYNGGFGCNSCSGAKQNPFLTIAVNEAHWCCTMRGGEGLSRAVQYSVLSNENEIIIPFYNNCVFNVKQGDHQATISEITSYPQKGESTFKLVSGNLNNSTILRLFAPSWADKYELTLNGKPIPFKTDQEFISIQNVLKEGDVIKLTFNVKMRTMETSNPNSIKGIRFFYGPLLLGYEGKGQLKLDKNDLPELSGDGTFKIKDKNVVLTTVSHLMNPNVWLENDYQKQVVFF